jgi:hypothetical protein
LSHTARFRGFAKLLYPFHPLFDADGAALEIVERRSDMLVTRLPDGSRRGIPAWMFDETVCREVRQTDRPRVDATSLLELMDLLERNGMEIRIVWDEYKSQPKENDGGNAAAIKTVNIPTGKRRSRQTDTGGKKVRMHRAAARVDRSGSQPKALRRRSQ